MIHWLHYCSCLLYVNIIIQSERKIKQRNTQAKSIFKIWKYYCCVCFVLFLLLTWMVCRMVFQIKNFHIHILNASCKLVRCVRNLNNKSQNWIKMPLHHISTQDCIFKQPFCYMIYVYIAILPNLFVWISVNWRVVLAWKHDSFICTWF